MKNTDNNNQITARVLELLPLYALGLLDAEEKQLVKSALADYPELQLQLKSEQEMVQYLREEKELFSLSGMENTEERLGNLLKREEFQSNIAKQVEKDSSSVKSKITSFIQSLLSADISKPQYVGFAAITTLSLALLFAITVPLFESESNFYPASIESEEIVSEKNSLLIGLRVEPDNLKLLEVLEKHNVETPTIAGKDGMYRLKFKMNNATETDLNRLMSILSEQKDLIYFVGEAY